MKNDYLKSIIVLVSICLIVGLLLSGVNGITAPIIEENDAKAASGAYLEVLPDAEGFEDVVGEFPEAVLEMKKDVGGSGFAFKLQGSSSYSQSPLQMILGIDNTGKITKLVITNYAETKGSAADFEPLFVGKDATMTDVVAGVTYTSDAIKNSVKAAYDTFYKYADVEKSDEQKLQDLYSVLIPSGQEIAAVEFSGAPASITGVYSTNPEIGYVITATDGTKTIAMGVNAYGKVNAIYDLDGNDLSGDTAYDSIIADAEAALPSVYEANHEKITTKMVETGIISSADAAKKVDFGSVSSSVVAVYEVSDGNAYVARAKGFGGIITVCYVINGDGEIVNYATLEQFEEAEMEYMKSEFGTVIVKQDYADKIIGKGTATLTEEDIIVAGSTFTSTATKACWNDIKAAADIINGEVDE